MPRLPFKVTEIACSVPSVELTKLIIGMEISHRGYFCLIFQDNIGKSHQDQSMISGKGEKVIQRTGEEMWVGVH